METKATTLWSLATVKAAVGETDDAKAEDLVRLADGISALVEREIRRLLVTRSIVEEQDGTGTRQLFLHRTPVVAVASLTILRHPTDAAPETIGADAYRVNKETGLLQLTADTFTRGVANVVATYTAGHGVQDAATLPQDLYLAGLELLKHVWDQAKAGGLAAQTVTLANGQTFVPRERWPLHVQKVLDDAKGTGW